MARPTGRLLLLAVLLCLVEPVGVVQSAASDLPDLATESAGYVAFVVLRVAVAGMSVAAGVAVWHLRDHAFAFAKIALAASAFATLVRFGWFPGNVPPGLRLPYALVVIGYNAAWYAYLVTRRER